MISKSLKLEGQTEECKAGRKGRGKGGKHVKEGGGKTGWIGAEKLQRKQQEGRRHPDQAAPYSDAWI